MRKIKHRHTVSLHGLAIVVVAAAAAATTSITITDINYNSRQHDEPVSFVEMIPLTLYKHSSEIQFSKSF